MILAESKTYVTFGCVGTRGADTLTGRDDPDLIAGMEGNDRMDGRGSSDTLYGDEGNNTSHVNEFNGASVSDTANCGPGMEDTVFIDKGIDTLRKSCEIRKPAQQ